MKPSTVRIAGKNWIIIAIGEHIVAQIAGIGVGVFIRTNESASIGVIITGLEVIEAEVIGIVIVASIAQGVQFGDGFGSIFRLGWYLGKRLRTVIICPYDFTIRVIVIRYNYVLLASIKYITSPCKLVM